MNRVIIGIMLLSGLVCCVKEEATPLAELLKQEQKITQLENDLLLGLRLDMPKQEFYDYCKGKNESGEFTDGGAYNQVLFEYEEGFSSPVQFWFFQEFENDKLFNQENKFKFKAWAPWNNDYDADKLLPEVLAHLKKHFGDDFIQVRTADEGQPLFVDIDANRRIDVYTKPLDDAYVYMDVTDIRK